MIGRIHFRGETLGEVTKCNGSKKIKLTDQLAYQRLLGRQSTDIIEVENTLLPYKIFKQRYLENATIEYEQ